MRSVATAVIGLTLLSSAMGCATGWVRIPFESETRNHFANHVKTITVKVFTYGKDYGAGGYVHNQAVRPIYKRLKALGYEVKFKKGKLEKWSHHNGAGLGYEATVLKDHSLLGDGHAYLEVYTFSQASRATRTWTTDQEIAAIRDSSGEQVGSITRERSHSSTSITLKVNGRATLFYVDRERPVSERVVEVSSGSGYDWDGFVSAALADIPARVASGGGDTELPKRLPRQETDCEALRTALNRLPGSTREEVHSSWWHRFRIKHPRTKDKKGELVRIDVFHDSQSLSPGAYTGNGILSVAFHAAGGRGWLSRYPNGAWDVRVIKGRTRIQIFYRGLKGEEAYRAEESVVKLVEAVCNHVQPR